MVLNKKENIHRPPAWHKWLQKLRAHLYRSPLYLVTLKKKNHLNVDGMPDMLSAGRVERGQNIFTGQFPFAGRLYQGEDTPWTVAQDDEAWQAHIHGYNWLADLCATNQPEALVKARHFLSSWLDLHGVWTQLAWRADVMGDRLVSWMGFAQKLTHSADETFTKPFYNSLSLQASHLARSYFKDLSGLRLLRALRGQLYIALFLEGFDKNLPRVLARLNQEFDQQVLADGGHVSRCPTSLLDLLALALEIKQVLELRKVELPDQLTRAIDRMAPMVRTLRHTDGGLALFHGAQEGDAGTIDQLLEQTGNQGQPLSDARHSGFQRIEAGKTVLLLDVASPPDITLHPHGHAAPLSFEISCGEERLLVNCGAVIGGDPNWQEALAATAAHNTLTVDEKNCQQLIHGGGIVPREISVSSTRFEEDGQVLIDAKHDAYRESLGLIHERSVYVNKMGTDIRFEDKLTGTGGNSFAISLHLHPEVQASLVQDGQAALLKLPSGAGWHLRVQGGKLEMRDSIYVGNPGQMRHTDQIIIQGPLRGEGADIKWRLSKIGGQ
ncbi:heparinase II/III family protein [Terasakiella sp. A23]|uniref:heparinase II/III family protein n=1 Tax=Terasakiella sp. FCG-A23 TaxID=3080561 RepID=UPI00295357C3|nr:heparinase II/III family protein [Terasakiella sp. A23]MDV7339802.1 heparinase II/III family protein [Terasakiella sp. A23]